MQRMLQAKVPSVHKFKANTLQQTSKRTSVHAQVDASSKRKGRAEEQKLRVAQGFRHFCNFCVHTPKWLSLNRRPSSELESNSNSSELQKVVESLVCREKRNWVAKMWSLVLKIWEIRFFVKKLGVRNFSA
jgi:hypothetical protein